MDFVKAIQGESHRAARLKEIYESSAFAKAEASQEKLKLLNSLDQNFHQWQNFFETQSILARDLSDFESRTRGILPILDQQRLFGTLKYFLPIYRELIRKQALAPLRKQAGRMEQAAGTSGYRKLVNQIPKFYRSEVPPNSEFTIGLLPIPGPRASSFATSLGAVESVGVVIGKSDLPGTMGVIAHELCHSFSTIGSWSEFFRKHPDPAAAMAFRNLEEALATAIGNGYAYRTIAGKDEQSSWYNNPVIEAFARALYPSAEAYLKEGRSIDEAFLEQAIALYREKVATLGETYDAYLDTVVISSGGHDRFQTNRLFLQTFPMKSIYSEPLTSDVWREPVGESWMASAVLVVNQKVKEDFSALAQRVPELASLRKIFSSPKPAFWEGRLGKRPFFLFKAENEEELAGLIKRVAARKKPDLGSGIKLVFEGPDSAP